MAVRFVDLAAQNLEVRDRVEREFAEIHKTTSYVGGPQVAAFERDFAAYLGVAHVVATASGTEALKLALLALGVGIGDEVITVPMTFVATAEAIAHSGARPVLVDVDPETCNLSPAALETYLATRRSLGNGATRERGRRVILPVHLYGLPAPMNQIRELADDFGAQVVEDACQAHGARFEIAGAWAMAGTVSAAGCFSFYPGKNLGAWGDAGAVVANDAELAARMRALRDHGRVSHHGHERVGFTARMDTLQAAVLLAKLERLEDWNARRRQIAAMYRKLFDGCAVAMQAEPDGFESCHHLFVIRSPWRDAIRAALLEAGVECGVHYPVPVHLQPAFRWLGYRAGDFPVSEEIAATALSLPMHPHLRDAEVIRVAEIVRHVCAIEQNRMQASQLMHSEDPQAAGHVRERAS